MKESVVWLVIVAVLVGVLWLDMRERRSWERYPQEHHCEPTGRSRQVTQYDFDVVFKMPSPRSVTEYEWRCDGGEIIWR